MSKQQKESYQQRFREIRNLRLFEDFKWDAIEKPQDLESLSRIEHKELSSSSDESQEMPDLQNLSKSNVQQPDQFAGESILLEQFCQMHQNNQSLNIETNNSVLENVSVQQVNKSFPNIESKKPEHISPLLSGKKSEPQITQEMGNLTTRIKFYEKRRAELKELIKKEQELKRRRESSKHAKKEPPKGENASTGANQSFQKRETLSLIEKLGKPSEAKTLSLLGELEPPNLKDTFNLKCRF